MRRVIAIVGPTASGKTRLGIELAQRLDGEIIGADSRQVYRQMDVGTAKPTAAERAAARHQLIDVVEPDKQFSLGRWLDLANEVLEDIWSRGNQPLLVGGTGQYVWALLEGWRVPRVPPDEGLRAELESREAVDLVAELRRVDPEAEAFVDPRNVRRVVRALEVFHATGRPFSYWRTKEAPRFESQVIGQRLPREELYRRIDERVEAMFAGGLVEEVERLLAMGYSRDLPSMSGIGYREVCEYLGGELDIKKATERTKTGTHRLARHQNSWFKPGDERIRWVEAGRPAFDKARRLAEQFVETSDIVAGVSGSPARQA
ncbi:MAG TPA: tRNA (adenosine(37)-N6)-dimethylallyltransferase MiaA [Dehalococcoidia bacterium]|jgi:tRNA dimethylallyltransferase|nr:tRNA (adenosine(37)-N6)-dimethylallyltransferase MiaA [Dehalococcoidia bacterium]